MRFLSLVWCLLACVCSFGADVKITGETKYQAGSLVKLKAEGADAKAALLWRVHPSKDVQRATSPRGVLEFAGKSGVYNVELLVITNDADTGLSVDESTVTVTIDPCCGQHPPEPKPDTPPKPDEPGAGKLDPLNAIGKIRFGNAGCSATVIGPRRPDGRWDVLTAAHCVPAVGSQGSYTTRDGSKMVGIRIVSLNRTADLAWAVTDNPVADLKYANLAEKTPAVDVKIWHSGFGVHVPGNREDGEVAGAPDGNGQFRLSLSVSSGDSGGGIFRNDTNELVSTVCCTTGMARKASVYGATIEAIRQARPRPTDRLEGVSDNEGEAWIPLPIPLRAQSGEASDWVPMPIPIRAS